ncbi:CHAD domain-containing protein [Pseudoduganella namucuonensis]|uniref:CHAD domain-containing protein n=1 Tax=Pseudoduganella namucuonensis TaxID=1035707 RepID=A0A1I7KHF4_9BURK|nr:CHAD domain-containing protein [Pseudoduganella namucuonensis]SFU96863.1 CHAD domain-containing protein [Pseudoduganella namucuonensis]
MAKPPLPEGPPPRPVKSSAVRLGKKMSLEDAFRRVALNCLAQIEANEPGVLLGDVESLHQMRVGLRRLRAALDLFQDLLAPGPALQAELDWLAGQLGAARDWDVLAGSTLRLLERDRDWGGLPALREAALRRAGALHEEVAAALRAPRYARLMAELGGWLDGQRWRRQGSGSAAGRSAALLDAPARTGLQPLLEHAQRRLRKRARKAAQAGGEDAAARHLLRIAAKKARYAAEFFHDLLPGKRVERYVGALSALQDRLGALNDMAVADGLLSEFSDEPGLGEHGIYARGYLAALSGREVRKLRQPLKRLGRLRAIQ